MLPDSDLAFQRRAPITAFFGGKLPPKTGW
jgi:hypothetical protein